MVRLNKIYTRTGDDGTTGLASGGRRPKCDLRVECIGTVDELNCAIGVARLHAGDALDLLLAAVQNDLFDLGAELATPETGEPLAYERLAVVETQTERLEAEIDRLNAGLEPLRSFVLPAGTPAAAHLHLARAIARRAERQMVALARVEGESVGHAALIYVNRLSDLLFVAARHANGAGADDVLWVPGQNR